MYNMDRYTVGSCKAVHVNGVKVHASQRPTVLVDSTSIHVLDIDGLVEAKKSSSLMSIHVSYEHNYNIRVGV